VDDAIEWFRSAGLRVEVVEEPEWFEDRPRRRHTDPAYHLTGTEVRVSVDGYEKVRVYAFESPSDFESLRNRESIGHIFQLYADYSAEQYPSVFVVGNVVVEVVGIDHDVLKKVCTALWHLKPTLELIPFGLPDFWDVDRQEAEEKAVEWLTDPDRGDDVFEDVAGVEARLVAFGDYTAWFTIGDPLHTTLPHPDTAVWLVEVKEGTKGVWARRYGVVLLDYGTGLIVHATYSETPPMLQAVPEIPPPGPIFLIARDGDKSDYDELAAGIAWERPPASAIVGLQLEDINAYVVERSDSRDGSWETWAVIYSAGWSVGLERSPESNQLPPARVSLLRGNEIWFWDWDVVEGQQYYYRVYGCTWLGRKTRYSNVVSAVAGDPIPDATHPDIQFDRGTLVPPCQ